MTTPTVQEGNKPARTINYPLSYSAQFWYRRKLWEAGIVERGNEPAADLLIHEAYSKAQDYEHFLSPAVCKLLGITYE